MEKILVVVASREDYDVAVKYGYDVYPILVTGVDAVRLVSSMNIIPRDYEIVKVGYKCNGFNVAVDIIYALGFEKVTVVGIDKQSIPWEGYDDGYVDDSDDYSTPIHTDKKGSEPIGDLDLLKALKEALERDSKI